MVPPISSPWIAAGKFWWTASFRSKARPISLSRFIAGSNANPIAACRLASAAIRYDLVADLLAFAQRSKPSALYGADVHEYVVATVVGLNEAEALGCVKPLHGSHAHGIVPSKDRHTRSLLSAGW